MKKKKHKCKFKNEKSRWHGTAPSGVTISIQFSDGCKCGKIKDVRFSNQGDK